MTPEQEQEYRDRMAAEELAADAYRVKQEQRPREEIERELAEAREKVIKAWTPETAMPVRIVK